jgi:phage-related minor tail protein
MTDAWQPFKASLAEGFQGVWDVMSQTGSSIQTVVIPAVNALNAALKETASSVQAVAAAAGVKVTLPTQAAAPLVNSSFLSGGGFGAPPAPHAAGGIFSTPHLGLVAEAGAEAIVPIDDPARGFPILSMAAGMMGIPTGKRSSDNIVYSPVYNITAQDSVVEEFRRAAAEAEENFAARMAAYRHQEARIAF